MHHSRNEDALSMSKYRPKRHGHRRQYSYQLIPLSKARLCVECGLIHQREICPRCRTCESAHRLAVFRYERIERRFDNDEHAQHGANTTSSVIYLRIGRHAAGNVEIEPEDASEYHGRKADHPSNRADFDESTASSNPIADNDSLSPQRSAPRKVALFDLCTRCKRKIPGCPVPICPFCGFYPEYR